MRKTFASMLLKIYQLCSIETKTRNADEMQELRNTRDNYASKETMRVTCLFYAHYAGVVALFSHRQRIMRRRDNARGLVCKGGVFPTSFESTAI